MSAALAYSIGWPEEAPNEPCKRPRLFLVYSRPNDPNGRGRVAAQQRGTHQRTPCGGNLTQVRETYSGVSGTRNTAKSYDSFDRLTAVTDGFNKTLRYIYDANGNRTALTDPDNNVTRYGFDALNRVSTVTNGGGTTTYAYDRSSLKTRVSYPNGTTAANTYDQARRILTLVNRQGAAPVSSYSYTYDANGNRTQQVENVTGTDETTTYAFDANDRLTTVNYPDKQTAYTFDANANRLTEVTTANSTTTLHKTYTYNTRNQLTKVADSITPANDAVYGFDANGNQTSKTQGTTVTNYAYDVKDQLQAVSQNAANIGLFSYDYQGHRIVKDMGGSIVRYAYDGNSVLLETDNTGSTLAKFDYGPDRLLSMTHASEGRAYYLFDALGSVSNLTTTNGAIQARYQYDAYGNYRSTAGASFNRFAFTGHEKDNETNLYYFKARFYDPDTGRFLNQDAYLGDVNTPPSLHRYLYAYGNPTVYHDPSGHITAMVDAEDKLEELGKDSLAVANDMSGAMKDAPWYAKPGLAIGWATAGAGYLGSQVAGAVVAGANLGANAYVIAADKVGKAVGTESALSGLAREAETELGATVDAVAPAIDAFKQDAPGTASRIAAGSVAAIGAQIKNAANGNSQAILDLASNVNPRQLLKNIKTDVGQMVEKKSVTAEASVVVKAEKRGVSAEANKVDASGRPLSSPQYSVAQQTELPASQFNFERRDHFKFANEKLNQDIIENPTLGEMLGSDVVEHVKPGARGKYSAESPPDWSWHHNEQNPKLLELVPRSQHRAPGAVQKSLHPDQGGGFKKLQEGLIK